MMFALISIFIFSSFYLKLSFKGSIAAGSLTQQVDQYGGEIPFRTSLERELARHHHAPVVTIVIQGGPNTVK
jgi:hypothetical protein